MAFGLRLEAFDHNLQYLCMSTGIDSLKCK